MNVLIVSSWCPYPADNGSRLRAYHLMKEMARQGHRLTLIAMAQEDSDLEAAEQEMQLCCAGGVTLWPSRFFRPDTLRATLGFFSPKPRMLLDTYHREAAQDIAGRCRSEAYDAIVALQTGVAHYIPADTPAPCVLEEVEVSLFLRDGKNAASWRGRLRHRLMLAKFRAHLASLAPRFALWTTVSETEKQAIEGFLRRKPLPPIQIVPNGVDLERNDWAPEADYEQDAFIYNGALSYSANLDAVRWFAADILPIIRQTRPTARLWVTGRNDVLSMDDPLRSDPAVFLTGYLEDIRPAVHSAAACVVPLRQGGGTRLKILEAMALGTPVVATTCGAEGLGATHGKEILIADTPAAFAGETLRLLQDAGLRARLAAEGRRLVEGRYGWDAIAARLCDTLPGIVSRREKEPQKALCL